MNFNQVDEQTIEMKNVRMIDLESGWIHDVAFSPLGDHLAWVSHNSIIFAVSANDPSRFASILFEIFHFDEDFFFCS